MNKTKPFDPATLLHTNNDLTNALNLALADPDPNVLMLTLNDIAKIKGVSELARESGLNRESLYKTLAGKTQPKWDTVHKIMDALGIKLQAVI